MEARSVVLESVTENGWGGKTWTQSPTFPVFLMKEGPLHIPPERYGDFLDWYAMDLARLSSGCAVPPLTLCERPSEPQYRLHVDVDAKGEKEIFVLTRLKDIAEVLQAYVAKCVVGDCQHDENTGLPIGTAIVCACGRYPVSGDRVVQYGWHIYWPSLLVSHDQHNSIVRGMRHFAAEEYRGVVGGDAIEWNRVLDMASMSLRFIGAQKYVNCPIAIEGSQCRGQCGNCDKGRVLSPHRYWPMRVLTLDGKEMPDQAELVSRTFPNLRNMVRWTSIRVVGRQEEFGIPRGPVETTWN